MFFFFNDTATTEIYTLSLYDALPISLERRARALQQPGVEFEAADGMLHARHRKVQPSEVHPQARESRSEEHTSELQSQSNIVCRLLLEKKKKLYNLTTTRSQCQST